MTELYTAAMTNEFQFFNDTFLFSTQIFNFYTHDDFLHLWANSDHNFLQILNAQSEHTLALINFINKVESADLFNDIENITTIYHYSVPNTKLSYPEPFIASPSFMHSDL